MFLRFQLFVKRFNLLFQSVLLMGIINKLHILTGNGLLQYLRLSWISLSTNTFTYLFLLQVRYLTQFSGGCSCCFWKWLICRFQQCLLFHWGILRFDIILRLLICFSNFHVLLLCEDLNATWSFLNWFVIMSDLSQGRSIGFTNP